MNDSAHSEAIKMTIDWYAFTPWTSLAGGALIGLAAALLLLFNGRIAGVSGIVGGLLRPVKSDALWRAAFVLGMVAAPLTWQIGAALPAISIDSDYPLLILAGVIVGISTRYGSGCTSGHGVCGISRLSPRCTFATLAFRSSVFVTVFLISHVLGV
jgi:uncharacterized membrane protein YedE/YeeE